MRTRKRRLPGREYVFLLSLMYHGFRLTHRRKRLKKKKGYVVPSTWREDASGIDFWIKMPRSLILYPAQVTQRGIKMFKERYKDDGKLSLAEFTKRSNDRIAFKRTMCQDNGIAFVLVRDFVGRMTNKTIAWGDIKALRYAIAHVSISGKNR